MSVKDQSKALTQEFFEIMLQQKQVEQRLEKLRADGVAFREATGAPASAGHTALVELETAKECATMTLDAMANACAAAKPDAETAGTPFECPRAVIHRSQKRRVDASIAA